MKEQKWHYRVFANHIHKSIGSYAARMSGVDAIIFKVEWWKIVTPSC